MPVITRTAAEVSALFEDKEEIAFIDVRETARFGSAHPLQAIPLPLGKLECGIAALVPRFGSWGTPTRRCSKAAFRHGPPRDWLFFPSSM
jgi:hypothetical protein